MRVIRSIIKILFFMLLISVIILFSAILVLRSNLAENYKVRKGGTLEVESIVPITAVYNGSRLSQAYNESEAGNEMTVDLKMFGLIPVSSVDVEVVDEMHVAVLGNPFGMKLYTEGVLVIDLTDVESIEGNINPAKEAGIKKGDYIVSVNGVKIYTNETMAEIVEKSDGRPMRFEVLRDGKTIFFNFSAIYSKENDCYKIGLWIRDSSAGIGTLTFYSPSTGVVCGLGHGICDESTESLLQLNSGELVGARISSVSKGEVGKPGELKGSFTHNKIAAIGLNLENGVYGFLEDKINVSNLTEVALKQEVKDGYAQILCTVDGDTPKLYSCTVKKRNSAYHSKTQNMIITVTDSELLEKTGGIVQGMSGSPIIQDGKLIGAVTHVLIDNPSSGYGIFAENMLTSSQTLKKAS